MGLAGVVRSDITYKYVKGQGWVPGSEYHSDVLEIIDERTSFDEEWCKIEIKSKDGRSYGGNWVENWTCRRWLYAEALKKGEHFATRPAQASEWFTRIVIINKDEYCR